MPGEKFCRAATSRSSLCASNMYDGQVGHCGPGGPIPPGSSRPLHHKSVYSAAKRCESGTTRARSSARHHVDVDDDDDDDDGVGPDSAPVMRLG